MKFTGDIVTLDQKLSKLDGYVSNWKDISSNQKQLKLENNYVINWYPSTGTINIQGKNDDIKKELESKLERLLSIDEYSEISNENNKPDINSIVEGKIKDFKQIVTGAEIINNLREDDSEIVIGLVGPVGVNYSNIVTEITNTLNNLFSYEVVNIRISEVVIKRLKIYKDESLKREYDRIKYMMDIGNMAREAFGESSLAIGAINYIYQERQKIPGKRVAYIINSLKHPEEVELLRTVYGDGFYLIGISADREKRKEFLIEFRSLSESEAETLMERDENEKLGHGQHTSNTFHLSDYFIHIDADSLKMQYGIVRFFEIIFGKPTVTPTFDEHAMFTAFTSSLRSADLSRQVGAVITKDSQVIASGANDIPKSGGGLYWPEYNEISKKVEDLAGGRDYLQGYDPNVSEKNSIIDDILSKVDYSGLLEEAKVRQVFKDALIKSKFKDITEYGRVVHAEMEALMMCSRNSISAQDATIYCTTFPCHNCAKHIIASGITRVVYVEPYPKSKASNFYADSIELKFYSPMEKKVYFEPFIGLGPRKFFDLFSMGLGSGRETVRKNKDGHVVEWDSHTAKIKVPLLKGSYLDRESDFLLGFKEMSS